MKIWKLRMTSSFEETVFVFENISENLKKYVLFVCMHVASVKCCFRLIYFVDISRFNFSNVLVSFLSHALFLR